MASRGYVTFVGESQSWCSGSVYSISIVVANKKGELVKVPA